MKSKPKDKPYCGVRKDVIATATPTLDWDAVYHFKTFVIDRYRIHKRKDVKKLPPPWTKNPILQEFKFTNVRREHDRQTRYLIDNITNNPSLTLEDKIVNTFLFRAWNNWSTLSSFAFPYPAQELYQPELKSRIRTKFAQLNKIDPNRLWYNNAYNQGGTKCAWKFADADLRAVPYKFGDEKAMGDDQYPDYEPDIPLRPFHVGVWLGRGHVVDRLLKAEDQLEAFNIIKSVRGFADFLAYQVFVDLTYIPEFPFSENDFTIAGPGCKKGLDYIFKDRDGMTYEECIFWLRDHINNSHDGGYNLFENDYIDDIAAFTEDYVNKTYDPDKLFSDLPAYDRCVNVMSLENCMCELSKYLRTVRNEGRPRCRYKQTKEN